MLMWVQSCKVTRCRTQGENSTRAGASGSLHSTATAAPLRSRQAGVYWQRLIQTIVVLRSVQEGRLIY